MSEPSFRTRIRAYYESQDLPQERLARLRALVRTARPPAGRRLVIVVGLAAAAACAIAVALLLPERGEGVTVAVAREIARNHAKKLDLEIHAASYEEIGSRMSRLDFRVVAPSAPAAEDLRLLGARYCSLRGCVAAQFRLVRPDGRTCTLYEVKDGPGFVGVEEGSTDLAGVSVHVWRQDGILLGLAVATD